MHTHLKIFMGLSGGAISIGGGYLLMKPSAPSYGLVDGMIRMPGDTDGEEYWKLNDQYKDHWEKCIKKFLDENGLQMKSMDQWKVSGDEEWNNQKTKIIGAYKKEFKLEVGEHDSGSPENMRTVIKNGIIRVCQGEDNEESRRKWCTPGGI